MKTYILPDFTDFRPAFDLYLAKLCLARFYLVKLWFRFRLPSSSGRPIVPRSWRKVGVFDFPRPILLQLEPGGQTRDTVSWKLGKMFACSLPKMLPCEN